MLRRAWWEPYHLFTPIISIIAAKACELSLSILPYDTPLSNYGLFKAEAKHQHPSYKGRVYLAHLEYKMDVQISFLTSERGSFKLALDGEDAERGVLAFAL